MRKINRYFYTNDKRIDNMDGYELPKEWWSRPYEYQFASNYLNKNDIILDAGCGIIHPFKFYASKRVKKVYAIDNDEKITQFDNSENLEFVLMDMKDIGKKFKEKFFDKVFCISVLEHMLKADAINIMKEFKKVLKDNGRLILTIDFPMLRPRHFVEMAEETGFEFVGKVNYELDKEKSIKGDYKGLRCYSAILKKKGIAKRGRPKKKIEYQNKAVIPEENK